MSDFVKHDVYLNIVINPLCISLEYQIKRRKNTGKTFAATLFAKRIYA